MWFSTHVGHRAGAAVNLSKVVHAPARTLTERISIGHNEDEVSNGSGTPATYIKIRKECYLGWREYPSISET